MIAIIFLYNNPNAEAVEFLKGLNRDNYKIFCAVDDNDNLYVSNNLITYIQVDNETCIKKGFTNSNLSIKVSAWDKVICYLCETKEKFEHFWLIEDNILIPTKDTIPSIDKKYPKTDLLTVRHVLNEDGKIFWHWKLAKGKINLPWASTLAGCMRISKNLLNEVSKYVTKNKTLLFYEFFYNTLAVHAKLSIESPKEMEGIKLKHNWKVEDISSDIIYRPISIKGQIDLRKKLEEKRLNLEKQLLLQKEKKEEEERLERERIENELREKDRQRLEELEKIKKLEEEEIKRKEDRENNKISERTLKLKKLIVAIRKREERLAQLDREIKFREDLLFEKLGLIIPYIKEEKVEKEIISEMQEIDNQTSPPLQSYNKVSNDDIIIEIN